MKNFERPALGLCVAALAASSLGCQQSAIDTINTNLTQVAAVTRTSSDARLPTVAVATALGGLELMKALSKPAGSGNLIGAGGMNFRLLDLTPGTNKKETIDTPEVKATVEYDSVVEGGVITSQIKSFSGKTSGYDISAEGKFVYTPAAKGSNGILGSVSAEMTGAISRGDLKVTLKTLNFATQDPMPQDVVQLGKLVLDMQAGKSLTQLNAELSVAKGQVTGEATVLVDGKQDGDKITLSQNGISFVPAAK